MRTFPIINDEIKTIGTGALNAGHNDGGSMTVLTVVYSNRGIGRQEAKIIASKLPPPDNEYSVGLGLECLPAK
jgi:hypothetical protein